MCEQLNQPNFSHVSWQMLVTDRNSRLHLMVVLNDSFEMVVWARKSTTTTTSSSSSASYVILWIHRVFLWRHSVLWPTALTSLFATAFTLNAASFSMSIISIQYSRVREFGVRARERENGSAILKINIKWASGKEMERMRAYWRKGNPYSYCVYWTW